MELGRPSHVASARLRDDTPSRPVRGLSWLCGAVTLHVDASDWRRTQTRFYESTSS